MIGRGIIYTMRTVLISVLLMLMGMVLHVGRRHTDGRHLWHELGLEVWGIRAMRARRKSLRIIYGWLLERASGLERDRCCS